MRIIKRGSLYIRRLWESHAFYFILVVVSLFIVGIGYIFNLHNIFYEFYKINSESINTSFISFFGIVFGFLFTSLAILFSLNNENSFFAKLLKDNENNKDVIVGYFRVGIILSFFIVHIALFLTITHINGNVQTDVPDFILNMSNDLCIYPVFIMFYLSILEIIVLILLLFVFIGLLKNDKS